MVEPHLVLQLQNDELMIYDTSTAKNVKVLVSDLASYAGSAATNQVTYWTSANEIGGATGFTFAGGANGAVTMGGNLTVSGNVNTGGTPSITPNTNFDTLVVTESAHSGITILSGNTSDGAIYFGDPDFNGAGQIKYSHASNSMTFTTDNDNATLTLDDGYNATFTGDVGIGGTGLYTTTRALNLPGKGISFKNDVSGSNNNWSYIYNTATASTSNLVFATGAALTALTLEHDGDAIFAEKVGVGGKYHTS